MSSVFFMTWNFYFYISVDFPILFVSSRIPKLPDDWYCPNGLLGVIQEETWHVLKGSGQYSTIGYHHFSLGRRVLVWMNRWCTATKWGNLLRGEFDSTSHHLNHYYLEVTLLVWYRGVMFPKLESEQNPSSLSGIIMMVNRSLHIDI